MLLILPCAGGCAGNYHKYILAIMNAVAYEYPGHWTRYDEPLVENAHEMVETVFREVVDKNRSKSFELFGHSMGGMIAWSLAKKLIGEGFAVDHLYLAACCDPQTMPTFLTDIRDDLSIKSFIKSIRRTSDKIVSSDFFERYLLPPIRSDLGIVHSLINDEMNKDQEVLPLNLTCLYGLNDPIVCKEDMMGWVKHVGGTFRIKGFEGDHFFLYDKENIIRIVDMIHK